jgi:Mrp family chromosome partitioning ATPase
MDTDKKTVPENANDHCPGVESNKAGKEDACAGCPNQNICASGEANKEDPAIAEVALKFANIKHTILVLSGKGGVGKSTVSSQLAHTLALDESLNIGLLDIDI